MKVQLVNDGMPKEIRRAKQCNTSTDSHSGEGGGVGTDGTGTRYKANKIRCKVKPLHNRSIGTRGFPMAARKICLVLPGDLDSQVVRPKQRGAS